MFSPNATESSPRARSKRFLIERLEERVAPGSLLWQSGLFESLAAAWASLCGSRGSERRRIVPIQIVAAQPSDVSPDATHVTGLSHEVRQNLPTWALEFLSQVEHELDKATVANANADSENSLSHSSRLDELLTRVDHELDRMTAVNAATPSPPEQAMPAWAEELLVEIQHETAASAKTSA